MKHLLKVTQEDIDNGIRQDPTSCPIARSLARDFGIHVGVEVEEEIILYIGGRMYTYKFRYDQDSIIERFIRVFDNEYPVEPFEKEINLEEFDNSDYFEE